MACQSGDLRISFRTVKVGIFVNPHKAGSLETLHALRSALHVRGCTVVLDQETAELAKESGGVAAAKFSDLVDIAAVIGGDGTMLHALSRLGNFEKPVAGINIGHLGFLTSCKDDELDIFAKAVVHRRGHAPEFFIALNEVTLARGDTGRLVSLSARVDGELLNDYRADGLIVATPTGSTAYSLSAGGPLIAPNAEVFVITPICPHSLGQRSLVLSNNVTIELSSEDRDCIPMLFTVDGRDSIRIESGDFVEIRKSASSFHLLRLEGQSFYQALRQKLHWQGV